MPRGPIDYRGLPLALTGATAATRYVGGTASGAPSTGTFQLGDTCPDQTGVIWVCTAAGSPGTWVNSATQTSSAKPIGFEWSYTQITATANITDTSEATATALISPAAFTPDGSPVLVEFFAPAIITDTSSATDIVTVTLFEGATQITRLGIVRTVVTAAPDAIGVCFKYRFTPTAAAHTYKLCAFVPFTTGTPNITAGLGGTGAYPPAYIRFTKV